MNAFKETFALRGNKASDTFRATKKLDHLLKEGAIMVALSILLFILLLVKHARRRLDLPTSSFTVQ